MYKQDRVKEFMQFVLDRLDDEAAQFLTAPEGFTVTTEQLLNDLEVFADEIFDGKMSRNGSALEVEFQNGQTFRFSVEEIKHETV